MTFTFVCSTHGFLGDFSNQKKILAKLKPEFVLCEDLEDYELVTKEDFEDFLEKKEISNMTSFSEVENLVRYCHENNIKLIGIDLPNFGFDEEMQKKIKKQELTDKEEQKLNIILKKREQLHLKKIKEYPDSVIILGSWHLRKDSVLRKELNNITIYGPVDEQGNLLLKPAENARFAHLRL